MPSGRLGKATLTAATQTLLYTVPALKIATVNIRVANRNTTAAKIRVAIVETGGGTPSVDDYITYDKSIAGSDILEETGILCSTGEMVYVYSDVANVSVRVHGFEETA
jgi:hypothetical protein